MKWIGQHIWDFISRFRSDVYLEATDSGTIASGGNLGLDSNNKVVKATGVSSSTLASTVTVTDSTANTLFPIVFHDESNGLLDDTGALMYNPNGAALTLKGSGNGSFNLMAIADSSNDVHLNFWNTKDGGAGADNDNLGTLTFYGKNDAGTPSTLVYGSLTTYIGDASDDDEAGIMTLKVATEGTERQVLTGTGDGASSKVDVGLGYGATSTTTLAGGLTVGGSTAAMTNAGLLSVGTQTNITRVGTLGSLQVDDININTKSIQILGDTDDTFTITTGAAGATTLTTVDDSAAGGHFEINADGNITLDAAAKQTYIKRGGADFINFDYNTGEYIQHAVANANDIFKINVGAEGATTISTTDADTAVGHLTLFADGDTIIKTTDGHGGKNFKINCNDNPFVQFSAESGDASDLYIYEAGGDSTDDHFTLKVEEHGATTIHCVDAAGTNANLQITAQGTAELAGTTVTLDSAGAITFERGSNSVEVPDAAGTLQLQGAKTGQIINVSLMKDDNYVLYLNTRTYWYSTAGYNYTGNINVSAGNWSSWSDDRQARHCGYIATQACKVNKVRFVGLFATSYTSGALDFEFALQKWTPGNDTTATVTTTYMTHTDHDGSYTEGKIYNLEFDVSGNNTLAAGDAFTLFARCVDSNASARIQIWYGNCHAQVELT